MAMVAVQERRRLTIDVEDVHIEHAQPSRRSVSCVKVLAHPLVRNGIAMYHLRLPARLRDRFARRVQIPPGLAVPFGSGPGAMAYVFGSAVLEILTRQRPVLPPQ